MKSRAIEEINTTEEQQMRAYYLLEDGPHGILSVFNPLHIASSRPEFLASHPSPHAHPSVSSFALHPFCKALLK